MPRRMENPGLGNIRIKNEKKHKSQGSEGKETHPGARTKGWRLPEISRESEQELRWEGNGMETNPSAWENFHGIPDWFGCEGP